MAGCTEMVKVAAIFAPGAAIRPVWFEWRRQRHTVRETSYFWKDRAGDAALFHFAVSDGCNLYELIYNLKEQNWTMGTIECGG